MTNSNITINQVTSARGGRYYEVAGDESVEGIQLPSATTVLGILNKPYLIPWLRKLHRDGVTDMLVRHGKQKLVGSDIIFSQTQWGQLQEEVVKFINSRGDEIRDAAMDIGNQAHAVIQLLSQDKQAMEQFLRFSAEGQAPVSASDTVVANALKWIQDSGMEMEWSERSVYHSMWHYAGTIDCMARDKQGKLWVIDWKSSNQLGRENAMQVAAYAGAYAHMYNCNPPNAVVIRLGKDKAEFEPRVVDVTPAFTQFLHCLFVYQNRNESLWEA